MVRIERVEKGSPAHRKGLRAGDILFSVGGHEIRDVLDYRFHIRSGALTLVYERGGTLREARIRKREEDDIGLQFATYLMDEQRRCRNACMFCFIDQLPKGMRETLYFKDDDERLSFLFGNYITLTNLTQRDIDRITGLHISPVNISVHTMNPELRARMMRNPSAGECLHWLEPLAAAGIRLNFQLVLCPGLSDGAELDRSIRDLASLLPAAQSVAVVPVGLTGHRDGLYPLISFTQETAEAVLAQVHAYQARMLEQYGTRLIYAADEFYLLAGREMPPLEEYEELCQLENGVGMSALLRSEFLEALPRWPGVPGQPCTIITGEAAAPLLTELVGAVRTKWPELVCDVIAVKNRFFGGYITVAGLLTGRDIVEQLRGQELAGAVLLPRSVLRRQGDVTLDDMRPEDIAAQLGAEVGIVDVDGRALLEALAPADDAGGRDAQEVI